MKGKKLQQAAAAAGIATHFNNFKGEPQEIAPETLEKLLAAMGDSGPRPATPLPGCVVLRAGRHLTLQPAGKGPWQWHLTTEQGKAFSGEVVTGEALLLPPGVGKGYHQLLLSQGKRQWASRLIVAPKRCYEPAALKKGEKLWGSCVQLYTVRSANNWGMGDFGDLQLLIGELAARGGAFVGLNPIHALYPAMAENASPYSPSSRRWLNVLYIDVAALADFQQSPAAQAWWQKKATQRLLQQARQSEWVDYARVAELKLTALRHAWAHFSQREEGDGDQASLAQFIADGGESLRCQAAYDALHGQLLQQDKNAWGWPVWPETWRDYQSAQVEEFINCHPQEVCFWQWLQWLAHAQFDRCWQASQQQGMPIGLYRDLAVGVAEGGAETWRDRSLYRLGASVGAPPDPLGPQGQNWGLPPMDPRVMQERGYQPFIDLLRANMASCGALRIDHVMSLLRLWWIPYGETADFGAYVYYPVDDLLAILALESERHRCMVIGEDLGIVPPEIIGKLRSHGVYSWKVLYFEQDSPDSYRPPQAWPRQSIASATTHDLPTLRGFWSAGDLALGERLGLYPDKVVLSELHHQRARQKQALLDALHHYGCVPQRFAGRADKVAMGPVLNRGLQRYIADSGSALLGLQPEDWLDMADPVNVPGTTTQYPNWRRKLSVTLEEMFADPAVNRLIKDLHRRRQNRES